MDQALGTVIGMTIAYIASFAGLILAWRAYRIHHREEGDRDNA